VEDEQSFTEATIREQFFNDFEDRRYLESAGSGMIYFELAEFEEGSAPGPWLQMVEQRIDDESPVYLEFGQKPSNSDESYTVLDDHAWRMAALRGSTVACIQLAWQRMFLGHYEEAFRWVSRALLIISDPAHWRVDLEYKGWTESDATFWCLQQFSTLQKVKDDDGLNLSFVDPRDIFPNRESIQALGVDYCIVCGFAKSVDQVCDHSLVVPYQSSKDAANANVHSYSRSDGAHEQGSELESDGQNDLQGDSKFPFCSNCGHNFENKVSNFCRSCGRSRH
jgi:hypothetical protein